jgi:hypothetical protein
MIWRAFFAASGFRKQLSPVASSSQASLERQVCRGVSSADGYAYFIAWMEIYMIGQLRRVVRSNGSTLLVCGLLAMSMSISACSSDDAAEATTTVVTSTDGTATLRIPDSALPAGVSADEISITRDDSRVTDFDGTARVWSFAPDGVVFKTPVRLTLDVETEEGDFFGMRHIADGDIEEPVIEVESIDAAGRVTVVSTEIDHFSSIAFFTLRTSQIVSVLKAEWKPEARDTNEGESLSVAMDLSGPSAFTTSITYIDALNRGIKEDIVYAGGAWESVIQWSASRPPLSPGFISTTANGAGTHTHEHSVTCDDDGPFTIDARIGGAITYSYTLTFLDTGLVRTNQTGQISTEIWASTSKECVPARETKPEYAAQLAELGSERTDEVRAPGSASVSLGDFGGKFGYYVWFDAAQTLDIGVTTTGSSSVLLFPQFSPGYDFVNAGGGTTHVTNLDSKRGNGVLTVIEGTGTATITVGK